MAMYNVLAIYVLLITINLSYDLRIPKLGDIYNNKYSKRINICKFLLLIL